MPLSNFVFSLQVLASLHICGASPITSYSSYVVKERHAVPRGWTEVGPAPKSEVINLQIGLTQSNEGIIEQHLIQISNPRHARYGQHLSSTEIDEIISPSKETGRLVKDWLRGHNVTTVSQNPAKDWISIPAISIENAEKLLQTKYSVFRHEDGTTVFRAPEWSLPLHLHEHIDVVQPTTSFFRPTARAKLSSTLVLDGESHSLSWWETYGKAHYANLDTNSSSVASVCNISFTTLECLRTLYGTIDYTPQVPDKNSIGINNYLNETSKRSDVQLFLQNFRPDAVSAAESFEIVIVADGPNDQGPYTPQQIAAQQNVEGNLDAELVLGFTYPTKMTAYNTGGMPPFIPDMQTQRNTNEPYLEWLNYVLAQESLPQVISTSYGDDEQTVPYSYAKRVCSGFAQLGARGISVLFSSGDSGVGPDGACVSNTDNSTLFLPAFPAGCPWVTAVGGTSGFEPEVAVQRYGSGAGFSNYFGAPEYQKDTVTAYISSLNGLYDGLYNKSGRGYPDVAAQGDRDVITWNGRIITVGGTSASCPTFSSVISLVNDALLAADKPVLGFLNPWIYGGAYKALTDVTSGSSIGCDGPGFPAQEGWDAVTGWGTPNFQKLMESAFEKSAEHYK